MKKAFLLLSVVVIISWCTGCKVLDKLTIFTIPFNTQTTIPSLVGVNLPFNIQTPAISTNSISEFEVNQTRKDMIEEITLNKLQLNVSDPEDGDLSFLKAIEIYVNGGDLEEKLIAWNDSIDTTEKSIELQTTPDDLQDFIKLDSLSLRVRATVKKLLLSDYTVDINSEFRVNARILGI